jgi:endonuclease YncB( thermonuclease family)
LIAQFLADSPWTDYAREQLNQRSEKEKLAELNNILQQKKASLNLAIAQLQAAKEKHREELYKLYKEQPQKDTSVEQAQITTQLKSFESELVRLGVVRSPYEGTIKKIKWVGQTDQELVAELTITVGSNKEISSVNAKSPATSTPPAASASKPDTTKSADKPKPDRREKQTPIPSSRGQGFQPSWQVISVHDGDTMRVRQGEKVERIRMACIDAPELKQPLGKESRDYLKSLVEQNRVTLKIVDTDRYGRRVAEVFVGGKLVQAEQVRSGMAYIYERYLSNCPDAAAVKQAEAIARSNRAGVWNGNYIKPWDYRRSQQ